MDSESLIKVIEDNIDNIFDEESYKKFMASIGRFHNYSLSNQFLILFSKPEAFRVAGFWNWKNKFGRSVKKGEKGIWILAPKRVNIYIEAKTGRPLKYNELSKSELGKALQTGTVVKKKIIKGFIGVTVFDVSQTEGKEIDESVMGITENFDDIQMLYRALESATQAKIEVTDELFALDTFGFYVPLLNRIKVRNMYSLQVAAVAVHEAGHAIARRFKEDGTIYEGEFNGWKKDDTPMMELREDDEEVIVESAAFAVMSYLGMDTSKSSFNYIHNWATAYRSEEAGKERLQKLLGFVSKIVDKVITAIELEKGIGVDDSEESIIEAIKEEEAEELLTTLEANAVRIKANGGVTA